MASKRRQIKRYRRLGNPVTGGKGNRSYPVDIFGKKARATPKRKKRSMF